MNAILTVYPATGDPVHDAARLVLASAPAPTEPPQLIPPSPASKKGPDARDREIQRLKDDLAKERARADSAENVVRILENRLNIPHTTPNRR